MVPVRQRLPIALALVAVLAATSVALAQPRFRVNGKENKDLSRNAERHNGQVMAPARPLFKQFGANIEKKGDWYSARRGGHEYRFRPGSRVWYDNDQPRYFRVAPYERNGALLLSALDLVAALGGRYDWDDRYQRANIWYGPVPPSAAYTVPVVQLQVLSPKSFGRVSARAMTVEGFATPYADLRILLYRATPGGDLLVFDTPARVSGTGQFAMRLPMFGPGTYRIYTQLLDPAGRILTGHRTTVYAS